LVSNLMEHHRRPILNFNDFVCKYKFSMESIGSRENGSPSIFLFLCSIILTQPPSNQEPGLKLLSQKKLPLLIISSLYRVSSSARLGPSLSLLVYKVRFT
jgi:hypothetical protein